MPPWVAALLRGTFPAVDVLVGRNDGHPACKKTEWWGASMVICLERGADLHAAQLMPLPLTVSCFSKTHIGFTFLVLAYPGSPGQRAVKRVCGVLTRDWMDTVCSPTLLWLRGLIHTLVSVFKHRSL